MERIKQYFSDMNRDKAVKIAAVLAGAISIVYALIFYFRNCFNSAATKKTNFYFGIIFIVMIAITIYVLRKLLLDKKWNYPRLFVIMSIAWTFCMQLVMPPISGVDEVQHYYSAYHCSNIMMGMKDHNLGLDKYHQMIWTDESFFYMRAEDYYMMPYVDVTFPYEYAILANGNWFKHGEDLQDNVECHINPTKASRYLVSAVGITIARLLGFGFAGVIFMGRFMNSLSLIIAGWIALKLLPVGRHQFFTFAFFPTLIHLCSSYSYDNMSILFSLALLTLCLYYGQPQVKLHAWDLIILGICVVFLIPNKTVYVIFAIWIFAIPVKKWWSDVVLSKKWYEYGILAVLIAGAAVVFKKVFVKYFWKVYSLIFWSSNESVSEVDPTRQVWSWEYFKGHKLETFKFAWDGIKSDFWFNIKHVVGSEIGHTNLNAQVPMACIIVMLLIMIAGIIFIKGKRLTKWQYIFLGLGIFICLVGIFVGCMTRFTPIESQRIQISFRYLIPLYMALCIILGTDAKENKLALTLIYVQNLTLIYAMCGLLYFLLHLRDGMPMPFEM
ncbi:DUF2142 domain-containing protein [Pseudobutyrivibrio xylanivorans]|uniref:DUF2142 domain-containing protein n=1 Tax=Pseudobutyrivibrio xylanivorans TaxID=185007 RepID=A0A5P6VT03_PSEXY|nr:DUF2142 domain-containing protein [Pseudobutyrivibrio xylanivorans]QFJ53981.1 DUF2142 domain-containing protein [Pseudobutyrivibrio xylanivorans]